MLTRLPDELVRLVLSHAVEVHNGVLIRTTFDECTKKYMLLVNVNILDTAVRRKLMDKIILPHNIHLKHKLTNVDMTCSTYMCSEPIDINRVITDIKFTEIFRICNVCSSVKKQFVSFGIEQDPPLSIVCKQLYERRTIR